MRADPRARQEAPLSICGEVERPLELTLAELAGLADTELVADFHCHEGWSRHGLRWRGVSLRALLQRAGARATGRYVTVGSGSFTVVLSREQAEDERVLLAVEQDGQPLTPGESGPRLVGPAEWDCFLGVKAVERIELTTEAEQATGPALARARLPR